MRIIDKNHDFYDYLQNPTDTLVFDRRGSFILGKEQICDRMYLFNRHYCDNKYRFIELQCGATFWVFLATMIKFERNGIKPLDYKLELLTAWKDFDKPNKLLDVNLVSLFFTHYNFKSKTRELDRKEITEDKIKSYISNKNCDMLNISKSETIVWNKKGSVTKVSTLPILSSSGIGSVVDPVDIFCAIEEYFSIEKSKAERTEAKGTTNTDKIVSHGFDTKTSFRGKV